mgnify:CR=1 FL=1
MSLLNMEEEAVIERLEFQVRLRWNQLQDERAFGTTETVKTALRLYRRARNMAEAAPEIAAGTRIRAEMSRHS